MVLTAVFLLTMVIYESQCQTLKDTEDILDTIFSGYNSDVRPAINQSLPVQIHVQTELVHIEEFKEVSEQLTSVVYHNLAWVDYRLTWNPLDFNGTMYIKIPVTKIWWPNLVLSNPVRKIQPIGGDQKWVIVKCSYNGMIELIIGDVVTSWCSVDVRHFPFDTQYCGMAFVPYGYNKYEVILSNKDEKVRLTNYFESGGWTLEDSEIMLQYPFDTAQYLITLCIRRRPVYFLVNIVFPVIFNSCLSMIVFLIPLESGERVSFSVSVLLALTVFMTIVGDNIPKHSLGMPYITYFLLINMAHSTLICFEAAISLAFFHKDGSPPTWLVNCIFKTRCFTCRGNKITNLTETINIQRHQEVDEKDADINPDDDSIEAPPQKDDKTVISWKDVSRKLDKLFSLSSFIFLIALVSAYVILVRIRNHSLT